MQISHIRSLYKTHGVDGFYEKQGDSYYNPHTTYISILLQKLKRYDSGIDLSCGDGLVTKTLTETKWVGVDPYLHIRYKEETGNDCFNSSIEQIATGKIQLPVSDVVVCCYAYDIYQKSYTQQLLWSLSNCADTLVLIRPNKKIIKSIWWELVAMDTCYKSCMTVYKKEL